MSNRSRKKKITYSISSSIMDETTVTTPSGTLPMATSSQIYQLTTETSPTWQAPVVPVGPVVRSLSSFTVSDTQSAATNVSQPSIIPEIQTVKCETVFDDHPCTKTTSHKCSLCSKTFTRRYNLKIHVEKHFGNFPHRCVVCGSGFTKKSALSKHILKHGIKRSTKLRPQCDICSKVFTRKYTARVHRAKHMENGLWKCPFCPSLFVNTSNLKLHLRKHTNGEHSLVTDDGTEDELPDIGNSSASSHLQGKKEVGQQSHTVSKRTQNEDTIDTSVCPPGHSGGTYCGSGIKERVESEAAIYRSISEDSVTRFTPDPVVLASWQGSQSDSSVSSSNEDNFESVQMEVKRETEGGQEITSDQQNNDTTANDVTNTWQTHAGLSSQYRWDEITRKRSNSVGFGSSLRQGISVDAVARLASATSTPMLTYNVDLSGLSQKSSISNSESTTYINPESVTLSHNSGTIHLPQITQSYRPDETPSGSTSQASLSVLPLQRKEGTHSSILSQPTNDTRSSWRCVHCCMSFEDGLMFVVHMGCHRQDNPFACNMCGHISADRLAFMLHFVQGRH